ncbi:efflux transporter outer membrane subunit [Sphingomonas sp. SM33]|uniref:Efflux transporter outer membrane subunit n=1 Tax=Sphingomonas telluris TaxID=2907998 RepID=A0ABS9VNN7_9SPHN|nr:efflux transporter outer membrane subunit [Sphingomonas telluris]MCH8616590.1 efflux transporter outer membrane subunit [Sphingomonas telluris]
MRTKPAIAHRVLSAACCISLLSACVQGNDYVKPSLEVPGKYRFADAASTQLEPLAGTWWIGYGDRHLDKLVGEALANNRDLRIATARVDEFAAILAGTKSQGLPQVGYGLSGQRARASEEKIPSIVNPLSTTFSTVLSASWEIDLWGRIRRETEAARANLLATEEARRGVTLTLISSVIIGYINLLDLDEQLRISEQTAAGRAKSVDVFEKRLAAGWISEFEMAQVRGEYELALASLPPLRQAIAVQENALSVLVGRNPGPIERATPQELAGFHQIAVPAGLPSELLTRRPDILQAEQQLIASNALIGAARALFFPSISLTGLFGFASGSLGSLFTGPARTWSFTGDVAGPIYTGGGLTAAVDQAEARRDQSLANYEQVVQNAFRDVDDSLVAVQQSAQFRDALARRVATLTRGVELANERYENGYSDYLEVLDTERSLFNAELQYASARGDYQRALVNVYRALGGDWTNLPPVTASTAQTPGGGTK